jgi:glycosyltransferase involved in cell wall biosynthesis
VSFGSNSEFVKKKVVIVSGIQLISNPRVFKEAKYLSENGFDVTVLAAIYDVESLSLTEELLRGTLFNHRVVFDGASTNVVERIKVFSCRIIGKLARVVHSIFGWESPLQLGNQVIPLLFAARRQTADLFIVHLEQALFVGCELLKDGKKVAIDVEDWYSEDGLPEDRAHRPLALIRRYERILLQSCCYSSTTSSVLSKSLAYRYQCTLPEVIFNTFAFDERELIDGQRKDRRDSKLPSITWFSQTVGPGRGLELLVAAINLIEFELELHVRGTLRPGFQKDLLAEVDKEKRRCVFFHTQVPQKELLSRIAEHDVGFAGELNDCMNKDLTIANKAFEYMRAGLAVVASDTNGHRELAENTEGFLLYQQNDAAGLAHIVTEFMLNPEMLANARKKNVTQAQAQFSWEVDSLKLLKLVETATS